MAISLKAARVNAGLTQKQLGDELGVSHVTIWKWESGKTEPKLTQFQRFCEVCGVSTSDIFLPKA